MPCAKVPAGNHTAADLAKDYERGQFVTLTPAELKALDVESSNIIDLETFLPRA
jgi:non-homologous end joining protein Ku